MTIARFAAILAVATTSALASAAAQDYTAEPTHAIAMHGEAKYGPDFDHFDYVNPDAPKGGTLTLEDSGGFDNFNPYILRGTPAGGLSYLGSNMIFEALLEPSEDEPFTKYGRLAETIEVPEDRSWIAFNLNPKARFQDGKPVTAEDVVWSFNTLVEKGSPIYASYWSDVQEVRATGERRALFIFKNNKNKELPLILGQMPVLPKHFWDGRDFSEPLTEPPVGSGPYTIESFEFGRRIAYKRDETYWGADIPVNKGQNNMDRIAYEVFRDREVATEAFKSGAFDFRAENSAKRWATAYNFPALDAGMVVKEEIPNNASGGLQGFVYNLRKPIFQDRTVREALGYAFDFEWTNQTLMYGSYARTNSYFTNTGLESSGLPEGAELALLEPLRDQLPPEVFTTPYKAPVSDGSGSDRRNLRTALKLLQDAGWSLQDGVMTKDGMRLEFEILMSQASTERLVLPFIDSLGKIGVKATPRLVDPIQYQNRIRDFDFDMTTGAFGQSTSPGNEQWEFWGSVVADQPGSRNIMGIKNPAIDALIRHVVAADSREDLEVATRALDRALLWNHYVIPQFHSDNFRLIYWNKFEHPDVAPKYGLGFPGTWWIDPDKAAAVRAYLGKR
ncbi:extracellular solute-binding protein [Thalassobaculum sp. OXR-137]|uniref:extracellular solute-binding protein n=1 Tax=Thalassobaculum sp. OXR-137 TaxID=3100173 RepID=UPI002AC9CB08|nr:extracellular solute-binding protein [Thalassobaculum sp. OXR-137]WPZ35116.1 extracellular solute-binding protein [Thalassobaculum sp. OXR-137]